jgi:regulator of replication initiation timing
MSVENKIKELLERVSVKASSLEEAMGQPRQGDSKDAPAPGSLIPAGGTSKDSTLSAKNAGDGSQPRQGDSKDAAVGKLYPASGAKDSTMKAANAGDTTQPKQGDSKDASYETREGEDENGETPDNTGAVVSKGINSNKKVTSEESEDDTDLEMVSEEEETEEEEATLEPIDLSPIFGEDLSEDFKTKATSIFEAAVIARVNLEMEKVAGSLEEKYAAEFAEYKEGIVEKVDAYLNYVVENWMEENKLAVENGLRTEIAEDFMSGLKALFKEHYIEVPEEKYDVLGELQGKVAELEESLNSQIENNVSLNTEVVDLKKKLIIKEMTKDLADTEASKLTKLLEGVEFDSADLYKEKVSVIKENYFPRDAVAKETTKQALIEDSRTQETSSKPNDVVSSYAQALSRTIKRQ